MATLLRTSTSLFGLDDRRDSSNCYVRISVRSSYKTCTDAATTNRRNPVYVEAAEQTYALSRAKSGVLSYFYKGTSEPAD
jgi:hypothetical protein